MHKLPRKLQDQVAAEMYQKLEKLKRQTMAKVDDILIKAALSPYPFTLWLDYRVPSLNTILGRVRRTIIEKKKAAAAMAVALAVTPGYPRAGTQRMHVIVTCYVIKQRDADNPVPKFAIDQLRYQGVLRDDDLAQWR